jgi:hypothetical protein
MPLTPSVLLLLGIGDPLLLVGVLALVGVLRLPTPVPLALTITGVFFNAAAVVAIVRSARRRNG